jgi:hypothetical protein
MITKFWLDSLKRTLRRRVQGWKDNIKICLRKIWIEGVDWIHLVQDKQALQNMVVNKILGSNGG